LFGRISSTEKVAIKPTPGQLLSQRGWAALLGEGGRVCLSHGSAMLDTMASGRICHKQGVHTSQLIQLDTKCMWRLWLVLE